MMLSAPRFWLYAQIRSVLIVCLRVGQQQLTYRFVLGNVNNQSHDLTVRANRRVVSLNCTIFQLLAHYDMNDFKKCNVI